MKAAMEEVVRSVSFINDPWPTIVLTVLLLGGITILWFLCRFVFYLIKRKYGQSTGGVTVEHALLLVMIAAIIVGALSLLGGSLKILFDLATSLFGVK